MQRASLAQLLVGCMEDRTRLWKSLENIAVELAGQISGYAMAGDMNYVDASDSAALFDRIYCNLVNVPSSLAGIAVNAYFEVNIFRLCTTQPLRSVMKHSAPRLTKHGRADFNLPHPFSQIRRIELCCLTFKDVDGWLSSDGSAEQDLISKIEHRLSLVVGQLQALSSLTLFLCSVGLDKTPSDHRLGLTQACHSGTYYTYVFPSTALVAAIAARTVTSLRKLKVLAYEEPVFPDPVLRELDGTAMTAAEVADVLKQSWRHNILVRGNGRGLNDFESKDST
ncbi:hypothetical protein CERZMDRAFT_88844 [Cercospora zeae-maydis SCOH1-5]|uniref:Uncharacterized protein n=1 Tax=Cercospora zeae-maydis SCOH1-5 TaxID=717836 RepID=A0A6A6F194_9PEZI|nr:hypothetical protein CERZMDRAFT_88844 [Cercospora zeae-maydis SCOH1-5]